MIHVERIGGEKPPVLRDKEEEETVDDLEQLPVVFSGAEAAGLDFSPKVLVGRVGEKPVTQDLDALLHSVAEVFPDPSTLLQGVSIVLLKETFRRVRSTERETGPVKEAEEGHEIRKALLLKEGGQIELDVSLAADKGGIPQQAQGESVRDDPPEDLRAIQVFLNQGMRSKPRSPACWNPSKFLPCTYNVNGRRVFSLSCPVGYGIGLAVNLVGLLIESQLMTQEAQKGDDP
jgi:hypothetical protein